MHLVKQVIHSVDGGKVLAGGVHGLARERVGGRLTLEVEAVSVHHFHPGLGEFFLALHRLVHTAAGQA